MNHHVIYYKFLSYRQYRYKKKSLLFLCLLVKNSFTGNR